MSNEPVIIEGPEAMAHFAMCQVIARLSIEARTGMVHSGGSTIQIAKKKYGITAHTKAKALLEMLKLYKETYGHEYGQRLQEPTDAQ